MDVSSLLLPMTLVAYVDARFDLARTIFFGSAGAVLIMGVPGFLLHRAMLRRLRADHAETWQALGRPTVVYYGSARTGRAVMRFLRGGEFTALGDPALASLCRAYRAFATVYTLTLAAMVGAWAIALLRR